MYKQKIGISILNNYQIATTKVIKMVKEIGFEAISPMWGKQIDLAPVIETARECGLIGLTTCIFCHMMAWLIGIITLNG